MDSNKWESKKIVDLLGGKGDTIKEKSKHVLGKFDEQLAKSVDKLSDIEEQMNFYSNAFNTMTNAINTLQNTVNEYTEDILAAGISAINITPKAGGLPVFMDRLNASYNDVADANRPQCSNNSYVGGVVVLYTAPSENRVKELATVVTELFSIDTWVRKEV